MCQTLQGGPEIGDYSRVELLSTSENQQRDNNPYYKHRSITHRQYVSARVTRIWSLRPQIHTRPLNSSQEFRIAAMIRVCNVQKPSSINKLTIKSIRKRHAYWSLPLTSNILKCCNSWYHIDQLLHTWLIARKRCPPKRCPPSLPGWGTWFLGSEQMVCSRPVWPRFFLTC